MNTQTADLDLLAERTARYARYSLSAGGLSTVLGGILLLVVLGFMFAAMLRDGRAPEGPLLGYIALVILLPFAAWRWFWSVSDFLVGVLLFCQSAIVIGGGNYPAIWLPYIAACTAVAVFYGWREHRDYLALRAELAGGADGA